MTSSGSIPMSTYTRAGKLGSGTYGSVVTVYDDEGNEFALKLFDEEDGVGDEEEQEEVGLPLGALREISVLRIFRHDNAHPNIVAIHDVQTDYLDDEEDAGGGTDGCISMAMELFPEGSLMDAIEKKFISKAEKVKIAHGLLSAVAHLHQNSIIHRDIKCDNVLLRRDDDGNLEAVLIDFSLAKIVDPSCMISGGENLKFQSFAIEGETTHTPSIGTPTYRAPEVIAEEEYGFPSDLWSVGVCLLELLRGKQMEVNKDKGALKLVQDCLDELPKEQPFPKLIRGLLNVDRNRRLTAQQALESTVFQKHGLTLAPKTLSTVNLQEALPFDNDDNECNDDDDDDETQKENVTSSMRNRNRSKKIRGKKKDPVLSRRWKRISMICEAMEWLNPMTAQAAMTYSLQMSELCDMDDPDDQALLDCVVLAHKFFEPRLTSLSDLNSIHSTFKSWDVDTYVDNEATIFMMLDYCLYPRRCFDL